MSEVSTSHIGSDRSEKLQNIVDLFEFEKKLVTELSQEVESKKRKSTVLFETVAKLERDILRREELLYSRRLVSEFFDSRISDYHSMHACIDEHLGAQQS